MAATHAPIELTPSGPAANPQHAVPPAGTRNLHKMVPGYLETERDRLLEP